MNKPFLFVGLGGSGGKTLRFLKRDLRHALSTLGWPVDRPLPQGYQFLQIDTPTLQDGRDIRSVPLLPPNEYLGLIGPGVSFTAITSALNAQPGVLNEFIGWRVPPAGLTVDVTIGAGQYRAVGRTVAVAQIDQIKERLTAAVRSINDVKTTGDFIELKDITSRQSRGKKSGGGKDSEAKSVDPVAVVISSLAGGTGAGLLMDVLDVLRGLSEADPWGSNSIAILYTPEVFKHIQSGQMKGIQPNSLAAISELLNGQYWHGMVTQGQGSLDVSQVGLKQSEILHRAGVTARLSQSGPMYPFLVGNTNASGVAFKNERQVFETIASTLSAWCLDEVVQEKIFQSVIGNWRARTDVTRAADRDLLINVGAPEEVAAPALQGLGCARVSVGTRYFNAFASQKIAKDALRWMLKYEEEQPEALDLMATKKLTNTTDIARELAAKRLIWFLNMCHLQEKGPEDNQIIDALTPSEWESELRAAIDEIFDSLESSKASAPTWIDRIMPAIKLRIEQFEKTMRPLLHRQAKEWVTRSSLDIQRAVEVSIADVGLNVTAQLLLLVKDYLVGDHGVVEELMGENEHKAYKEFSSESQWSQQLFAELAGIKGAFTKEQNSDSLYLAVEKASDCAAYVFDAQLREIAEQLIKSFANGVITPLYGAIVNARTSLERKASEESAEWPDWNQIEATGDSIPPLSEFTLIDHRKFGDHFTSLLAETVGDDPTQTEMHRTVVRSAVISSNFLREEDEHKGSSENRHLLTFVEREKWHPGILVLPDAKTSQTEMRVDVQLDPADLVARAERWLRRSGTPFEALLRSAISTYTDDNQPRLSEQVKQDRRTALRVALASAARASAPLVGISAVLQTLLFKAPLKSELIFSTIPIGTGHPCRKELEDTLNEFLPVNAQGNKDPGEVFRQNDLIESIQITSVLPASHHPILFTSLLSPIQERWNQSSRKGQQRQAFWTFRRARLAGEAIPAPQEHILCMIRGWFTARLLNLVRLPDVSESKPISIAQPWSPAVGVARFPHPLLTSVGNPVRAREALFAILEALGLAFVEVNSTGLLRPLDAYISLREFGRSEPGVAGGGSSILRYDTVNPLLSKWIISGELESEHGEGKKSEKDLRRDLGGQTLDPDLKAASTLVARRNAVLDLLRQTQALYLGDVEAKRLACLNNPTMLGQPPFVAALQTTAEDNSDPVNTALKMLIEAIERIDEGDRRTEKSL